MSIEEEFDVWATTTLTETWGINYSAGNSVVTSGAGLKYYEALWSGLMAAPETTEKKLDQIAVYPEDKKEMDRLFGGNVSYAKRQRAMITIIKRERLVEKIRRQVLSPLEELEGRITRVDTSPETPITEPPSPPEEAR